jgi:hypothetical protein
MLLIGIAQLRNQAIDGFGCETVAAQFEPECSTGTFGSFHDQFFSTIAHYGFHLRTVVAAR